MISTARAELPKATLDQLKRATVMVKVRAKDGRLSSGSGFFIRENLIVTNAHVLQAEEPWERIESDVEVVYASGSADQKILRCTISSVDVPRDIAFLNLVDDFNAPTIPLVKSDSLIESTPIYVLGFPLGEKLGLAGESPSLTIVNGHVSAFRRDRFGGLDAIQLNATLIPGNSGGPVVDNKGHLVGISRATLSLTKVGIAIPADHAEEDLAGRVTAAALTVLQDQSKIEVKLRVVDPLKKITRMAVYYWTNDKGEQLPPASGTQTQTQGTTGKSRLYIELKADKDMKDLWSGKIPELEVSEEKELWLQFAMANGNQLRQQAPICHTRDVRSQQLKVKEQLDATKSPQYKQLEARLKASSPFTLEPEVQPVKFAERIANLDADSSNMLRSKAIEVKLRKKRIIDVAAAPQGHSIYAILEDDPHVWVLDSGSLETTSKILVAQSPISLGQYRDKLAVACNESQSVQVIDVNTQEVVDTLRIPDKELFPTRIVGTAPDGSLMSLWRRNQDVKNLSSLYLLDQDKKRPPLKLVEASMDWCVMLPGKDKVVAQTKENLNDIVSGRPYLLSIADDPLHSEITVSGGVLNFITSQRCYFCSPGNLLLVPAESLLDGKFQRITLRKNLESNADTTYLPGHVLPQLGPKGHIISIDWTQNAAVAPAVVPTDQAIVQVTDLTSNQIRKTIHIDGLPNSLKIGASRFSAKPHMIYVPGRELMVAICDDTPGTVYAAPCATPVD